MSERRRPPQPVEPFLIYDLMIVLLEHMFP